MNEFLKVMNGKLDRIDFKMRYPNEYKEALAAEAAGEFRFRPDPEVDPTFNPTRTGMEYGQNGTGLTARREHSDGHEYAGPSSTSDGEAERLAQQRKELPTDQYGNVLDGSEQEGSVGPAVVSSSARQAAAQLGRLGGSVKSDRKTASSRENGKKGGRPKKVSE